MPIVLLTGPRQAGKTTLVKKVAQYCREEFQMGAVLYDGSKTMPLGNDIWAVPLSSLWGK